MYREVVFVQVPKTGRISILPVCHRHSIKVIGHNIRNKEYLSLAKYKEINPNCYAFAFVRNPWDRVVSAYFYLIRGGDNEDDRKERELYVPQSEFRTFVMESFKTNRIFQQMHFRPQYLWLSNEKGLVVDSIGKFENLQWCFSNYCKLFGLPNYKLPHFNKTSHDHYLNLYDDVTWEIIRNAYRKDIELFGYDSDYPRIK